MMNLSVRGWMHFLNTSAESKGEHPVARIEKDMLDAEQFSP